MLKAVEGVYRKGKVELLEPVDAPEGSRVIVTWIPVAKQLDLREREVVEVKPAEVRRRPEMAADDDLPPW